jgi:hypothetical protein
LKIPIIRLGQYSKELRALVHRLTVSVLVSHKVNGGAQGSGARRFYIKWLLHNTDAEEMLELSSWQGFLLSVRGLITGQGCSGVVLKWSIVIA